MKTNEVLKKLRSTKGFTQAEMADVLDVSLSAYQKYEREKNSVMPSIDVLVRIADYFNVSVDCLLGREPEEFETISTLNLTALEKMIVKDYLELPAENRTAIMDFLQKAVDKVENE